MGVDFASDMLEQGRRKIAIWQLGNIELLEGDGEHLSFAENSFDAVICSAGIFPPNIGSCAAALSMALP